MDLKLIWKYLFILFVAILTMPSVTAQQKREASVNVLTWWGYLDKPWVAKMVEENCHAQLSVDDYYSDTEFLRRWRSNKKIYDVIIFPSVLLNEIRTDITLPNSELKNQAKNYYPIIRDKYYEGHYPPNVVFFLHSLSGFLWNPQVISISEEDTVPSIFNKASGKYVAIMGEPVEVSLLVDAALRPYASLTYNEDWNGEGLLDYNSFKALIQNSKPYITNEFGQVFQDKNFAFAYLWIGQELYYLRHYPLSHYKILVHPRTSYIVTDMLAIVNNKPSSVCAAKLLTSKPFLSQLQNETYYISPYANTDQITDPEYKKLYEDALRELPQLEWVGYISPGNFERLSEQWKQIEFKLKNESKEP